MLTPSRLVLARRRRRMTLSNLASNSNVSVRSITAFENGHKQPSLETVSALASALRVPTSFLEAPALDEIPVENVSFRALSKMSALDRESALASGQIAMVINDWIEKRFELPQSKVPTWPHLEPESAAEQLRALWGLGEAPVPNLVHLMEVNGVRVFSLASDCLSVDAFSMRRSDTPYVFLNTSKSGERGRFDAAHELGHLVMHSDHRIPHGPEAEQEAQRFASAFLMPRSGILAQSLYQATPEQILKAKVKWKVAAIALTVRLHELRLVSDWGYRTAAKQLSHLGYRRSEPNGISRESSQLLGKVVKALRTQRVSWAEWANQLNLTIDELNSHMFGLVPVGLEGGSQEIHTERPVLTLVSS